MKTDNEEKQRGGRPDAEETTDIRQEVKPQG
jgi:hypothetical protein